MNRKISLSIEDIYIKYAGEAFGATGSHNALTLRMIFGSAWDGTAKTAYFTDALGSASVSIVLGLDKLVGGAYEVDVPSEALKYAGEATVTIKGVLTSGDTTTKAITTAAGHFRVLDSELPESAGNAGTITPSDKDQLQAEIAGLENLFTTTKTAAETAAANAKVSETNAKASETAAARFAASAEASKTAAAESSATAATSANTAGSAAAAAVENASHAAESAKAAENTAKSIVTEEAARQAAEKVRQANETARQNAESARQTAENNRAQTETARNVWEDYDSAKNYQPGNKVYWQGSSYVCLKACSGISPENGAYWQLVVRSGFTSDSAFGFDVVNGRLLCYYSGDNPPPFRLGSDGHLYVDLDKSYDLGKVTGGSGSGGGVDIDLGMTGATVGQVAKVKAVDTDGKPTAWEPVDMAGGTGSKPYKILYNQTLSEAAVVKVDADADAAACNEYILSMAIPKGDAAMAYNRYTTILCVADCVNNVRVVDASFGTLHQARMLKSDDGGAWIDFFSGQTSTATPSLIWGPRTNWSNPVRQKVTDLSPILYASKVELPAGTIIIIGGR